MSPQAEVTLEQRHADYRAAESRAEAAAAAYLAARARGWIGQHVIDEMDAAQLGLRQAKRRLEDTQRRLAKRGLA